MKGFKRKLNERKNKSKKNFKIVHFKIYEIKDNGVGQLNRNSLFFLEINYK
jgi:hypothetical protein